MTRGAAATRVLLLAAAVQGGACWQLLPLSARRARPAAAQEQHLLQQVRGAQLPEQGLLLHRGLARGRMAGASCCAAQQDTVRAAMGGGVREMPPDCWDAHNHLQLSRKDAGTQCLPQVGLFHLHLRPLVFAY